MAERRDAGRQVCGELGARDLLALRGQARASARRAPDLGAPRAAATAAESVRSWRWVGATVLLEKALAR